MAALLAPKIWKLLPIDTENLDSLENQLIASVAYKRFTFHSVGSNSTIQDASQTLFYIT